MDQETQYNERYLNKLHKDILFIMDEIDRICRENNLRYYLMCGSCLGAVRHKGFIPWDDDLDIAMPYDDFTRFIKLTSTEGKKLSESFYLRWLTTEKYYNHSFAKICLKGTAFRESNGLSAQNAGIYVDVFPLYPCKPYSKRIEIKEHVVSFLEKCIHYKGAEKQMLNWNLKRVLKCVITNLLSNYAIYKLMVMLIRPLDEKKSDFQVFFATPYPIRRMIFPKEWHGVGKRIQFEDREYIGPSCPELCMKQIYGKDYMSLPPINKRKCHYPIRVVFSDGEELLFEKQNKINYCDLLD